MAQMSAEQLVARLIRDAFPFPGADGALAEPRVTDWERVIESAEENAVGPLLYASLKKLGREHELPAGSIERLRVSYLRSDTANWLALDELQSLLAAFGAEQIPVVLLKGGALATTLYPESGLRPMSDLDLLISRAQLEQVEKILNDRGYGSPVELSEGFGPQLTNYRAFERGGKNPAHVEIHWHLFKSPYYCQRVPIEWFWDHTAEITIDKQHLSHLHCNAASAVQVLRAKLKDPERSERGSNLRARAFNREAQFLHLAAHFALHHRAERLVWSYDLALMLAGAEMDWGILLDAAERFGLVPSLRLAVTRVQDIWGVSVPPIVLERLNASRVGWRDRTAFAIMTAPRGNARFFLDACSQPALGLKAQFVWQHIFPARAYMRERYRIRDERWMPPYYTWRLVQGPWRMIRSIVSTIIRH